MPDWLLLCIPLLILASVAAWTHWVQKRHHWQAISTSAIAPLLATLPLALYCMPIVELGPTTVRVPLWMVLATAELALITGPFLFAVALWQRRGHSLPFSSLLLQLCHGLSWAALTAFGLQAGINT